MSGKPPHSGSDAPKVSSGEASVRYKHGIELPVKAPKSAVKRQKTSKRAGSGNTIIRLLKQISSGFKKGWLGIWGLITTIWGAAHAIDRAIWQVFKRAWVHVNKTIIKLSSWVLDGARALLQWLPTPAGQGYCAFFALIAIIGGLWVTNQMHLTTLSLKASQANLLESIALEKIRQEGPFEADPVMARIGGRYLRLSDIEAAARNAGTIGKEERLSVDSEFTRELVVSFVDQHILIEAAKDEGFVEDEALKSRINAARDRLVAASYIEKAVDETITEDKLRAFYETQVDITNLGEELRGRHILVQSRSDALKILEAVDQGEDFAEIARTTSIDRGTAPHGGDTGYITRDMVSERFARNVFAYGAGSITPPFQTDDGWNLVQILERRNADGIAYDDIKENLRRFLTLRTISEKVAALKQNYDVVIYKDGLTPPQNLVSRKDDKDSEG